MAVTIDAKQQVGGGVTLYGFTSQFVGLGVTLYSEGVNLTPVEAAWFGPSGTLLLSGTTVVYTSSIGTVVGNFSVSGGSTRPYTFTLTANPNSYFSVGGSTLSVASTLAVGTPQITVRASDTGVSVINGSFYISITAPSSAYPSMAFNITSNSMYIPLLGGIG